MRARVALLSVSTVVALGGVLVACGTGEQADCAATADAVVAVACVPDTGGGEGGDDRRSSDLPEVGFDHADEVSVGTRIVIDEDATLEVLDGPANAFRPSSPDGIYVAMVPGTYRVVEYVHMPCGGPPSDDDARTITIVGRGRADADDGESSEATSRGPSGFVGGRALAPRC